MRRIFSASLIIAITFIVYVTAAAQSPGKIIDRYKKASGANAANRIKSTSMSGTIKAGENAPGHFSYRTSSPDRLRVDIDAADLKVSECYNGKSAWRVDARGLRTLLGSEAKRLRLQALLANSRLRDLSKNRITPQPVSKQSIYGKEANVIEFIKDEARVKIFFDAASNLPVKQEQETADGKEEVFYSDYRAIDGVMEPFSIKIKKGESEWLIAIDRVEHNRAVEQADFRYPQVEGARPLPDLESLMKAVIANQENTEQLREHYTFRATEIERKQDNGKLKEGDTRLYDVTPVGGRFVRRLVSVNGKELSASEREKEDRRVQKDVEDLIKEREKQLKKKQEAEARGEKYQDDEDDVTILDFLRICEITSVRREVYRGHEVIAFDFEPRKGFKPRNRGENLVSKLAGTMWVDEEARQIARLEARLTDSYKVGGGLLASLSPSSAVVFEQEKVDGEIWLPSFSEMNFSARVLLFAKLNRNFVRRYSDYKKYQIDTRYEMSKPKESSKP